VQVSKPSENKVSAFCLRLLKALASKSLQRVWHKAVCPSNEEQGHYFVLEIQLLLEATTSLP